MDMKLDNCARCRRVFPRVQSPVCPDCQPMEDADYEKIRDVLDYDSEYSAEEVAEAAEVSIECVLRMLDAGMISSAVFGDEVRCGRCGAPAISRSKRLCRACVIKLDAEFTKAVSQTRLNKRAQEEAAAEKVREMVDAKRKTPLKGVPRGHNPQKP